ncbi:RHS repeat-associated core domain-containing protein, partial [Serratia fonticola]
GLYYNLNRYYDPGVGRYLTADPVKLAGGLNPYQYVDGNPVGWVDPLGLFKTDVTGAERSSVNTGTPKLPEIPWSNSTVKRASDQLDRGARDVYVNSRADAEELFRGKYVGEGYRNAENFNSVTTKDYFEVNRSNKEPYYHWDDVPVSDISTRKVYMVNHEVNSLHGEMPHLQLHPVGEKAIRIYWPNKMESKK